MSTRRFKTLRLNVKDKKKIKSQRIKPLTLIQANQFIIDWHRHHKPVVGHRFSLGSFDQNNNLHGVVVVGRPVARREDPYLTAEVTRLATDGSCNCCSFLYGAAARVAREMGFEKIQTFILQEEDGVSLKAAGWDLVSVSRGGQWKHTDGKLRRSDQPVCPKKKWEKKFQ